MTPDATRASEHVAEHVQTPDAEAQPKYLLTITDAARALGVSVRTVQRRLDAEEYEAATLAGKRCVRLSASDFPDGVPDDVMLDATGDSVDRTALKATRDATHDSTALVPLREVGGGQMQVLAALLDAVAEELARRHADEQKKPTAQESAAKLLLNLEEAQVLTGLSRAHLRAAIQSGELQARRLGRGWKVRRTDLEKYLAEVFK